MDSLEFNGISSLSTLFLTSKARTRSICAENPTGAPGEGGKCPLEKGVARDAARDLGIGWKVNPFIIIEPGQRYDIAKIEGSGCIQHIWITPTGQFRNTIIRIYWDNQEQPSVESPLGDFFACGWGEYSQISSIAVCVNPGSALNCYWPMPFRKHCRIEITNIDDKPIRIFYQIDYCLTEISEFAAYFHARFNRANPLPYKEVFTILDGVEGQGQYVGTYLAWGSNNKGWWGEGEIKFFLDNDSDFPTICGTGTEDYFCGSYNFEDPVSHDRYVPFTTPYSGLAQVIEPNKLYKSQMRFGLYRWHITDPIRFERRIKVTIQALGWRSGGRYLPLQDDLSSVAYWYHTLPTAPFSQFYDRDALEII